MGSVHYIWVMIRRYFNWRTALFIIAIGIISGTVLYSSYLAQKIESEEKQRVEEWIQSHKLQMNSTENESISMVALVQKDNEDIPLIGTDEKDSILDVLNLDSTALKTNPYFFREKLEEYKSQHQPIIYEISHNPYIANKIYYGNSKLLNEVRYYPIIQLMVVALFVAIGLSLLIIKNKSTQNQVWAGMAKETAHQLGTPLSSLTAWIEILRAKLKSEEDDMMFNEMQKDIDRLVLIAERFSKIGSIPELERYRLVDVLQNGIDYISKRASKKIKIFLKNDTDINLFAMLNPPLFEWVLENLMKNALDAMEGTGEIQVTAFQRENYVNIDITDTGKGILKNNLEQIFEPGFSTKKRGWGLGLTLARRIIEEYHHGKIFVKDSSPKGTTFRIILKTAE